MNPAAPYIFPGALLGSVILAFLAFTVTSGMVLPANLNTPGPSSESQSLDGDPIQASAQIDEGAGVTAEEEISQEEVQPEIAVSEDEEDEDIEDIDCKVSGSFPGKILKWCNQITKFAEKNDLDPDLIAALILQESGGNATAYSKSGAVGLMQVMPRDGLAASFSCVNGPCFANRPTIKQLEDPQFNLQYGTKMLAGLVRKHGDEREALKAYGPMNVGYYYADIVLGLYKRYRE